MAIIGVLVAVSIPIFTSQLEKSRDAVTMSNIRAAYAEVQAAYLTQDTKATSAQTITQNNQTITINPVSSGSQTVTISNVVSKGQAAGMANSGELPFALNPATVLDAMGQTPGSYTLTFTYTTTGENTTVVLTNAVIPS